MEADGKAPLEGKLRELYARRSEIEQERARLRRELRGINAEIVEVLGRLEGLEGNSLPEAEHVPDVAITMKPRSEWPQEFR